ncbi:MAG TPA: hypothetical protein VFM57_01015 [Thermoleophilaceae bacterium]|nr:hypothetical protein [Thermoleophilaceae bacterium]
MRRTDSIGGPGSDLLGAAQRFRPAAQEQARHVVAPEALAPRHGRSTVTPIIARANEPRATERVA